MKRISIDPVTRLEGHGKIDIFLNDEGDVENVYLQIPELRGFEQFCVGRPAEDMPNLTARICGVCPEAHHMAATKALDALFHVDPPPAAKKLRELFYSIFYATDHTTHFYALGGPDFVVGPTAPAAERNILGVVKKVGMDIAGKVLKMRRDGHHLIQMMGGRRVHPNWGLPGGVSRGINEEQRQEIERLGRDAVEFARFSLKLFEDVVLKNSRVPEDHHRRYLRPPHLQHGHGRRGQLRRTSTTARSASSGRTAGNTPSTTPGTTANTWPSGSSRGAT